MKMIDSTLQELWTIKDGIAKEHAYDLDELVHYLKEKYQPDVEAELSHVSPSKESESARRLRLQTPEKYNQA
jgi:2-oxoglutarate dehydrogenase complex dehydrogenase (E1) component-like enzyme